MSSQQAWSQDPGGRSVYWTGSEWIHPTWNQDNAGRVVFWSPQHQEWLYPSILSSGQNAQNYGGSSASMDKGKAPATPRSGGGTYGAGLAATQASGGASLVDNLTSAVGSLGLGSSSMPAVEPEPTFRYQADQKSGVTEYLVTSQSKGVQSKFQKGPAQFITDSSALEKGLTASKKFKGTGNTKPDAYEPLDKRFAVRKDPRKFFRLGRVLMMLHAEPAGGTRSAVTAVTRDSRYGEDFYIKPRRFIVVNEGKGSCTAIAIGTYGYQGVAKKGVQKSDHAIVYSTKEPPANMPAPAELPSRNEAPMKPQKIRVDVNDRVADALHPMSRINFAKVYTIEHNVKVRDVGMVNQASMSDFYSVFWNMQLEHATSQQQHARLLQTAKAVLSNRPRNDSFGGPSNQDRPRNDEDDDEDEDEDDDEDDDDEEDDGEGGESDESLEDDR